MLEIDCKDRKGGSQDQAIQKGQGDRAQHSPIGGSFNSWPAICSGVKGLMFRSTFLFP